MCYLCPRTFRYLCPPSVHREAEPELREREGEQDERDRVFFTFTLGAGVTPAARRAGDYFFIFGVARSVTIAAIAANRSWPTAMNRPSASAVSVPFADRVPCVKILRPSTRSTCASKTSSVSRGVG